MCEIIMIDGESTNLNARTSMNRTPLHLATIHNHYEVVELLIKMGAKIDLVDNDFNTCLHYASNQGYEDIVIFLLTSSANITIKNNLGRTPVDLSLNYETYLLFVNYSKKTKTEICESGYTRTVFFNSLRHNSREDQINKILIKEKISPNQTDLKLFETRPKLDKRSGKRKIFFKLPDSKVGPKDFLAICSLGRGSFGHVYLVEKKDTGENYALKVLSKEKIIEKGLERYAYTERNILMKINHPFIVRLHYAFQTAEKLALVMDYCPNGDLSRILQREKKLSEEKARFYIIEIILGLQELHRNNIIFRDLKPDNILIDEIGHIKITDFGLSKENMKNGKLAKSFCGTAVYFAPEMLNREGHTKSIDWYVLGALLYEMLNGRPPFYSPDREKLYHNIRKANLDLDFDISEEAKDLLSQLLNKNPKKRLGSSKLDAEEIKAHRFFKGVDWNSFLAKKVDPPPFNPIARIKKKISLFSVYGSLEDTNDKPLKIDNWSVLNN